MSASRSVGACNTAPKHAADLSTGKLPGHLACLTLRDFYPKADTPGCTKSWMPACAGMTGAAAVDSTGIRPSDCWWPD